MSLRQKLTRPLVIEPIGDHTHTVIFLHRFPAETTEDELRGKVLAQKMTKNHQTLQEQFPAVRWVFPYPKAHARHWSNLSAEDKAELGLDLVGLPYITQIVLQQAKRAGGLDKIILGGQGETAEAAHESMSLFPEPSRAQAASPEAMAGFIREYFHPSWTDISQLRLAGFVGMHAQGGQVTRDVKNYGIACKLSGAKGINTAIVTNTPHKFIQGGYKVQTTTWDGKRIDDFAGFLADMGIHRVQKNPSMTSGGNGAEQLTPKDRSGGQQDGGKKDDAKEQLSDVQKHALQVMKEKKATEQTRNKILQKIEADKVERKIRHERQKQARLAREATIKAESRTGPTNNQLDTGDTAEYGTSSPVSYNHPYSSQAEEGQVDAEDMTDGDLLAKSSRQNARENARYLAQMNQRAGGDSEWDPQSQVRGEMSTGQMRALGLSNEQDDNGSGEAGGQHVKEAPVVKSERE